MLDDELEFFVLREDPGEWEELVKNELAMGSRDSNIMRVIESMYWEADRSSAFHRFLESKELKCIYRILDYFNVDEKDSVCEIGGGSGHLVWSLGQLGFRNLSLIEPNSCHITGTGYLQTRSDANKIQIINDLAQWYNDKSVRYRVMITRNCVHHFKNISMTAACIRKKMEDNGLWFVFKEWYADSPLELYTKIRDHPYCQKYMVYEYPFPARHYVEAIEIAGFELIGIVPAKYADDCIGNYAEGLELHTNTVFTGTVDYLLRKAPRLTVIAYHWETFWNRYARSNFRRFTRPQCMIFKRAEIV